MVQLNGAQAVTDLIFVADRKSAPDRGLIEEAFLSRTRINKKPGRAALIACNETDLRQFMLTPESQAIMKLHVIGHTVRSKSQDKVLTFGDYDASGLTDLLNEPMLDKPDLTKISLNGCHTGRRSNDGALSMAETVANGLRIGKGRLAIGSFYGFAVMQSDGRNHSISQKRDPADLHEIKWNRAHWQPRPVFTAADPEANERIRRQAENDARPMVFQ